MLVKILVRLGLPRGLRHTFLHLTRAILLAIRLANIPSVSGIARWLVALRTTSSGIGNLARVTTVLTVENARPVSVKEFPLRIRGLVPQVVIILGLWSMLLVLRLAGTVTSGSRLLSRPVTVNPIPRLCSLSLNVGVEVIRLATLGRCRIVQATETSLFSERLHRKIGRFGHLDEVLVIRLVILEIVLPTCKLLWLLSDPLRLCRLTVKIVKFVLANCRVRRLQWLERLLSLRTRISIVCGVLLGCYARWQSLVLLSATRAALLRPT